MKVTLNDLMLQLLFRSFDLHITMDESMFSSRENYDLFNEGLSSVVRALTEFDHEFIERVPKEIRNG